ncbi:PKD domain-containing protein [Pseudoalteromonas peptidolytica]|uniref:PKD/Chitinase domain-containing protein n=1 Tax=Pseudoalteromonas peptidolytica F12-50-A1 TaxID=1315280 RepID=A0A8I0MRZ2_9GAMM|nr:PKD domain-containing protein [Pseudoalteromonas peptidolytica]MBE0344690.1 hypothetical protein [Pseudoalteromonas peptidolytica F12-50-A1]NLR16684.1 PKD domain-containing protein [Pseudoalteromonas peptidolytica]GEK08686.1 hypothetical protein PPE03_09350 [Pseudoalteromonas peptidolytica]
MNKRLILLALFLGATLTACGGSGGSSATANNNNSSNSNNNTGTDSSTDNNNSNTDNTQLEAKISPIQSVYTGATVKLIGTSSVVSANATVAWSITAKPQNSTAQIADKSSLLNEFVADVAGDYEVQLTIKSASQESTAKASVKVTDKPVEPTNRAPKAVITPFKERAVKSEQVTLSAKDSSDPDGDRLSYKWQVSSANNALDFHLINPEGEYAVFAGRDYGVFTISLTVHDGKTYSETVTKQIEVYDDRPELKAVISAPTEVILGSVNFVELKSEGSQYPRAVTPLWSFDSKPSGSQAKMATPSGFITSAQLDKPGQYQIRFSLKDEYGRVSEATHTITAKYGEARTPLVFVDAPESTKINEAIELSAKRSTDASGRPLTYAWTFEPREPGLTYSVSNENTDTVTFTPHGEGYYRYSVKVSNGELSDTATGMVKATPENNEPTVSISPRISVALEGQTKVFEISAEDKDGDPLTYQWSFSAKPEISTAVINGSDNRASITFNEVGNYVPNCTVSDGKVEVDISAFIQVRAVQNGAPTIAALDAQGMLKVGTEVQLASTVVDADSHTQHLTYFWTVTEPSGKVIEGAAVNDATLRFTPAVSGDHQVKLSVIDEKSAAVATKVVTLSVE